MTKIQTIPYVPVAESVQRRSRLFIRGHLLTRLVPYLLLGVPCYSNFQIWKWREMWERNLRIRITVPAGIGTGYSQSTHSTINGPLTSTAHTAEQQPHFLHTIALKTHTKPFLYHDEIIGDCRRLCDDCADAVCEC
jgi:hypothetical protein